MHRVLILYGTPTNPQAFQDYYLNSHLAVAAKLPGLRSLRYSFDLAAADGPAPYFAIAEAEFDSAAAYEAAMASPEGQAVLADIPNYATGGVAVLDYTLQGPEPPRAEAEVVGVHEIDLGAAADPAEFERLAAAAVAAVAPPGMSARMLKGNRGHRTGKYLLLFEIDTVENRDMVFPVADSQDPGPALQAHFDAHPATAEAWGQLISFEPSTELSTDYVDLRA
jgi:uncharacterized protein (TIGR02118 family)